MRGMYDFIWNAAIAGKQSIAWRGMIGKQKLEKLKGNPGFWITPGDDDSKGEKKAWTGSVNEWCTRAGCFGTKPPVKRSGQSWRVTYGQGSASHAYEWLGIIIWSLIRSDWCSRQFFWVGRWGGDLGGYGLWNQGNSGWISCFSLLCRLLALSQWLVPRYL